MVTVKAALAFMPGMSSTELKAIQFFMVFVFDGKDKVWSVC